MRSFRDSIWFGPIVFCVGCCAVSVFGHGLGLY
jgi:hypothetical protein